MCPAEGPAAGAEAETAELLKITVSGYQYYEQGRGYPDAAKLYILADFFDVSLDYLMGRSDTRERMP